ncbi:FecR family protein [Pedobacter frigidisoli]|uniref:FecR family protein n=1 Tax=Pedobacter frigidisoli TaxID=2530455 RepID=UPI002930ED16|nr:FecR domain-containing protein [Pedobacter frigidisoli]
MYQDYFHYTKSDFLQDDAFVRHIKYADSETAVVWKNYLNNNPVNLQEYIDAKHELEYVIRAVKRIPTSDRKGAVWAAVRERIPVERGNYLKIKRLITASTAAAAVIGLCALGVVLTELYYGQRRNVTTPYSRVKEVVLPDSSRIVLNSNTNLHYNAHWRPNQPREVWLDGEAYFEIKHQNKKPENILPGQRFVVHTSAIDIQVLGTIFNVKARQQQHSVVLVSGSVAVKKTGDSVWHLLKPGQEFIFETKSKKVSTAQANPLMLTAWKDRSVILPYHTRFKDIIPQLEENYGVNIKLADDQIGERYIEGILPLTNQDNLFFILSNVLRIEINKQHNSWIFEPIGQQDKNKQQ